MMNFGKMQIKTMITKTILIFPYLIQPYEQQSQILGKKFLLNLIGAHPKTPNGH